ncbi:MAG: TolC family protein [Acidobacteria bacterium]|nr:TolC family protein [Acidobacteriota bacterium]
MLPKPPLGMLVLLVCAPALTAAQDRLRLEDLIAEALRRSPEVLAAQKGYEAARQRPAQESSLPDPMLSLGYTSSGSPRPFAGLGDVPMANAGVMLSQEFPFPGKRKLRGDIAAREAEAVFQQYEAVQLSVVSRVKQAFHRLGYAWSAAEVLERNRDLLRKFLRTTEARYAVGKAQQQDVFKAQTQLSILETRLAKLTQERRSREAEINSLLARPVESVLGRPVEAAPASPHVTLEDLFAQARQNAPVLRREEKMVQRAELAVNLARKDYYPDYTLSAGIYHMGAMPSTYMARVDFKLPGWFWRKQRAGVAEDVSSLGEARRKLEAAGQTLAFRIKDDYLMAETSYRLMEMYSSTVIPQTSLALQSSLAAYETGGVDFLTVLANFSTMLDYELNYHEELQSYLVALARLEEMTGVSLP